MADPAEHHPHFDLLPFLPHSHGYLLDYFRSQTAAAAPAMTISLALWLAALASAATWADLHWPFDFSPDWQAGVDLPPPRPF